jgi:Mg-chelatase subunit ChlD
MSDEPQEPMDPRPEPTAREQLEMRVLSVLLGEADIAEKAAVEEILSQDTGLQAYKAQMQKNLGLAGEAAQSLWPAGKDGMPGLSGERREGIAKLWSELTNGTLEGEGPKGKDNVIRPNFMDKVHPMLPVGLAASMAILLGGVWFPKFLDQQKESRVAMSTQMPAVRDESRRMEDRGVAEEESEAIFNQSFERKHAPMPNSLAADKATIGDYPETDSIEGKTEEFFDANRSLSLDSKVGPGSSDKNGDRLGLDFKNEESGALAAKRLAEVSTISGEILSRLEANNEKQLEIQTEVVDTIRLQTQVGAGEEFEKSSKQMEKKPRELSKSIKEEALQKARPMEAPAQTASGSGRKGGRLGSFADNAPAPDAPKPATPSRPALNLAQGIPPTTSVAPPILPGNLNAGDSPTVSSATKAPETPAPATEAEPAFLSKVHKATAADANLAADRRKFGQEGEKIASGSAQPSKPMSAPVVVTAPASRPVPAKELLVTAQAPAPKSAPAAPTYSPVSNFSRAQESFESGGSIRGTYEQTQRLPAPSGEPLSKPVSAEPPPEQGSGQMTTSLSSNSEVAQGIDVAGLSFSSRFDSGFSVPPSSGLTLQDGQSKTPVSIEAPARELANVPSGTSRPTSGTYRADGSKTKKQRERDIDEVDDLISALPEPTANHGAIYGNARQVPGTEGRELKFQDPKAAEMETSPPAPFADSDDATPDPAAPKGYLVVGKDIDGRGVLEGVNKLKGNNLVLEDAEKTVAQAFDQAKFEDFTIANGKAVAKGERERKAIMDDLAKEVPIELPQPKPEVDTDDNPFSTFSLNVTDASFRLCQASLLNGQLPPFHIVRAEEFINAFDYRDPAPATGNPLAFAWDRARHPFAHNRDLVRFSIQTTAEGRQGGQPLNLVLAIDNSGSMERADRVAILKEALKVLSTQLHPQDKVSVIAFARTPRLWMDGQTGQSASQKLANYDALVPEGGTNIEAALALAYDTAAKHFIPDGNNRVILLTDGAANLGEVVPDSLKQTVEANRKKAIALDCFGIGWDGYNDHLMEALARNGDGRYAFLNSPADVDRDFAKKLAGALKLAAADVKVQVEFNPKRVKTHRQVGYLRHQLKKEDFRDNSVDAAEIGAAESGNAIYVVQTDPQGSGPVGIVHVRYREPATGEYKETSWLLPYRYNIPALDESTPSMKLAASASLFAEWLGRSPFAGDVELPKLQQWLTGLEDQFPANSPVRELQQMVRIAGVAR